MDGIKLFGVLRRKTAFAVAREIDSQASAQNTFVRGHPLHTQVLRNGKNLFRHAALGRPHADWPNAEDLLMQIQSAPQLFPRVFWMEKTILRQGQSGSRNGTHIGVADERQNGMIERRSRNFDSSLLRGGGMGGQHFTQQSALSGDHECLILERESLTLLDQRGDIRIVQKELVEPCDLREHLQIGEVLRLKIFFGPFGGIARLRGNAPKAHGSVDSGRSCSPDSPETDIAGRSGVRRR